MSQASRIKEMRQLIGLSQEAFARSISISRANLSQIELENQLPTIEALQKIARKYNISYDWLIDGNGNIEYDKTKGVFKIDNVALNVAPSVHPKALNEPNPDYTKGLVPGMVTIDESGVENIVLVDTKAAAGYPAKVLEPEFYKQLPGFHLPGGEFQNASFRAFEVSGDSMVNTLYHGDWVICRFLEKPEYIREGYIHVIVTTDQVLVKRVLNRVKTSKKLILQSDNAAYPNITVDISDVRELWYVKSKMSFYLPNLNRDLLRQIDDLTGRIHDLEDEFHDMQLSLNKKKK